MKRPAICHSLFGTLCGQLILGVALVHAVLMTLFIWDLVTRQRDFLFEFQAERAMALSQSLATSSAAWMASDDLAGMQELVDALRRYPELRFAMLVNEQGQVLAHTDRTLCGRYLRDVPREARQTVVNRTLTLVDVAAPAVLAGRNLGWARVGIGQQLAGQRLRQITRTGISYALSAIVIGSLIAWALGYNITRRLRAVQTAIDKVRAGDNLARSPIFGNDEAAVMAGEFNTMLDALAERDAELRAVSAYNRSLLEASLDPLWTIAPSGKITDVNTAAVTQTGYARAEMIGKDFCHCFTDLEAVRAAYREAFRQGSVRGVPLELEHSDGRVMAVLFNASEYRDQNGEVAGVLGAARDITERKLTEDALAESEAKFKAISEQAFSGVNLIQDGVFKYVNPKFAEMFGYTIDECLNQMPFGKLIHPDDLARAEEEVKKRLSGGHSHYFIRGLKKDGSVFDVEIYGSTCTYNRRPATVGTCLDITDARRAEKDRLRLAEQLRDVQKAESLTRMAGAIAHNLNNKLFAVMGNLELALDDLPPEHERLCRKINEALHASQSASEIGRLMLAYIGQTFAKRVPVDLGETLDRTASLFHASLSKNVRLVTEIPTQRLMVSGDEAHLGQILGNLILNASEAIGEKEGRITIGVCKISETALRKSIGKTRFFPLDYEVSQTDYACLSVSDTGEGISAEIEDKIFEPFFTTRFTGRGMGLSVALGLVRSHGGAVSVQSEPGCGSTFHVFLPLYTAPVAVVVDKDCRVGAGDKKRGLALLVDDEPMLRELGLSYLERLGYDAVAAGDGPSALDAFQKRRDEFSLVILDLSMPGMNGWETLLALRSMRHDIPVIMASGYDEAQVMAGDHPEKPQAFLHKPYKINALKAVFDAIENAGS